MEDQLDSKVRLLEETSRCYEKSKIDLRDLKNALRTAESKNEKLELEVATLKKELAAKAPAAASSNSNEAMAALQKELEALMLENERLKREHEDDKKTRDELTAVLVRPSAPVE